MTIKQVTVMRNDLNMRKGKMIAQGQHGSMAFITKNLQWGITNEEGVWCQIDLTPVAWEWLEGSFTKICVRVDSEEELLTIHQTALDAGLVSHLVTDNGLTEFGGVPTITCCAIGPDTDERIDPITGHLKLL
jgi:PTH2 family peptidyl-tRNA hydrolase